MSKNNVRTYAFRMMEESRIKKIKAEDLLALVKSYEKTRIILDELVHQCRVQFRNPSSGAWSENLNEALRKQIECATSHLGCSDE